RIPRRYEPKFDIALETASWRAWLWSASPCRRLWDHASLFERCSSHVRKRRGLLFFGRNLARAKKRGLARGDAFGWPSVNHVLLRRLGRSLLSLAALITLVGDSGPRPRVSKNSTPAPRLDDRFDCCAGCRLDRILRMVYPAETDA